MKRYFTSKIVGTGTDQDPYRSAIQSQIDTERIANPSFDASSVAIIPTHPEGHPQAGHPKFDRCIVVVSGTDMRPFQNKPDIDELPSVELDVKVSAIHTATKNQMIARLNARGFDTAFIGNADGYREVIRTIGQQLEPGFNENSFDVE